MKILLVSPRSSSPKATYREYPLGLGAVGTALTSAGHDVRLVDLAVEKPGTSLLDVARQHGAEVIGFSVITPTFTAVASHLMQLRRELPDTYLLVGGIHATLFPEDLLRAGADVAVLGEGEQTAVTVLDRVATNEPLAGVPGTAILVDGRVIRGPPAPLLLPSQWPRVDRSFFDPERYTHHSVAGARGCPWRCAFCSNVAQPASSARVREPAEVSEELAWLETRYGAREVFFVDDVFLVDRHRARSFCAAKRSRASRISWACQLRPDGIDDELAGRMREAGCNRISFGVESGSDEILARARKGLTTEQVRAGICATQRAGIRTKTGWIYGLPGPLQEQRRSIDLMLALRPDEISVHALIPFPGTVYYAAPERHGLRIRDPKAFESFTFGGIGENVSYSYLSCAELEDLFRETSVRLEREGYVSSDLARPGDRWVYSTPLQAESLRVFSDGVEVLS